jgi:hypothetical protein
MSQLFSSADLNVAFKNVQGNADAAISNFSDDNVLSYSAEDLTNSVYEEFAVKAPVVDEARIFTDWADGFVPEYMTPNPNYQQAPQVRGRI